ncbi:unnamed protein product [Rotaria sp. Silwood2]|nr:unnamed protein product [Rotaria sp. Silwood2]CAF4014932.1 unnamed protein product [Rotaria sp. Silwood2]
MNSLTASYNDSESLGSVRFSLIKSNNQKSHGDKSEELGGCGITEETLLRPIVSSMNTPTTGISKFLGKLVRRLFDKHVRSTTIIDGVHFIRLSKRCTANDCLKTTTYLCTFDITDIYTV